MNTADFRSLIEEAVDKTDRPEPRIIAGLVDNQLTDADRLELFAAFLPGIVGDIIRNLRGSAPLPGENGRQKSNGQKTSRARRVKDWYAAWLNEALHVESTWKKLKDCTADDLLFAVKERSAQIDALHGAVTYYASLASLLEVHAVSTIGQLPRSVIADFLGKTEETAA